MTPPETVANEIITTCIERLAFISLEAIPADEREEAEVMVRSQLEILESYLVESINSFDTQIKHIFPLTPKLRVPTYQSFHETIVLLDVCYFTKALMDVMESNMSNLDYYISKRYLQASCARIRKLVIQCFAAAHNAAKQVQGEMKHAFTGSEIIKAGIGEPDDVGDSVGAELRQLVGVPWMKNLCATLLESWDQALDGVVQIKAP